MLTWTAVILTFALIFDVYGDVCPDGSQCPDGQTCCLISEGSNSYGCCPLPSAVCCSDKQHCCPSGTTCDPPYCIQGKFNLPWKRTEERILARQVNFQTKPTKVNDLVVCPGGQSSCPQGNTCCPTASGKWKCCRHQFAVCCDDMQHCCPSGKKCHLPFCFIDDFGLPWEKTIESVPTQTEKVQKPNKKVGSVVCPDGQSACPDGNTCCQLATGQWGCCPLPSAVCCNDKQHCCPSGTTCDPPYCLKAGVRLPWEKTLESLPTETEKVQKPNKKVGSVVCPGGQSSCPDGNTCCQLATGQWGCCPLPSAVCCSDKQHCCPSGTTCDPPYCLKAGVRLPWQRTVESLPNKIEKVQKPNKKVGSVVCPDGQSACPDGNTCCKLSTGAWGCCPLPSAVCCNDGEHCCPSNTICQPPYCISQGIRLPWFKKVKSQPMMVKTELATNEQNPESVVCPDGKSACPDGNTCCQLPIGWGCCPLPQAVCCSDEQHCCPSGTVCDPPYCRTQNVFQELARKIKSSKRS